LTVTITERLSPNFGRRRGGLRPGLIVLHYTAMQDAEAALARMCDPAAEVSAHYLITLGGDVVRLVPEDMRAWHAGNGAWAGRGDVNSRSIGIELDNRGDHPFAEPQMAALQELMHGIMQRWDIPPDGVIGHSDMAPGRKADPGPRFDWARLARQGLCRVPGGAGADADITQTAFMARAGAAGYDARLPFETVLAAVRLRYAPWRTGPLCRADMAI
jgi:N-acetylmuramoyl-L-alanine amidase